MDVFDRAVMMISFASTARPSRGFMGSKGIGLRAGGHTSREARPKGAELHERSEEASWVDRRRARSTTLPVREALNGPQERSDMINNETRVTLADGAVEKNATPKALTGSSSLAFQDTYVEPSFRRKYAIFHSP